MNNLSQISIPPKIGEYSHFDCRLKTNDHYIVHTNLLPILGGSCHYSLPFIGENESVHSYGKITKIINVFKPPCQVSNKIH